MEERMRGRLGGRMGVGRKEGWIKIRIEGKVEEGWKLRWKKGSKERK